jgi:hypothetical protein
MISNTFNFLLTIKNRPIRWRTLCVIFRHRGITQKKEYSNGISIEKITLIMHLHTPILIRITAATKKHFNATWPAALFFLFQLLT